jgi:hypothetical protein
VPAKNLQWDGNDRKARLHNETFRQCIEGARGNVKVQFCGAFGVIVVTGDGDDYTAVTLPYTPAEKR